MSPTTPTRNHDTPPPCGPRPPSDIFLHLLCCRSTCPSHSAPLLTHRDAHHTPTGTTMQYEWGFRETPLVCRDCGHNLCRGCTIVECQELQWECWACQRVCQYYSAKERLRVEQRCIGCGKRCGSEDVRVWTRNETCEVCLVWGAGKRSCEGCTCWEGNGS
ncbi:hypothetical protein EX30DRAFT_158282 [Ascodesmis nigricans]|uniref:Uncharacterized protein n=1 Tax=Ascodesmis nigricans TaxID=341454 RepID=A0A4S2MN66_9PEZI|nr:hypothetical protein EX30DRAFT_158282 [Ascodesmis nigricans]